MFLEVGHPGAPQESHLDTLWAFFSRFLRASKWNATTCIKKLEAALKWRREYGIYDTLTLESIKDHVRTSLCIGCHVHFKSLTYLQRAVSEGEGGYIRIQRRGPTGFL